METYTIQKEVYQKQVKRRFRVIIPIVVLVLLAVVAWDLYTAKGVEFNSLAIIFPLVLGYIGFSMVRGIRKQTDLILSYTLTITDSEITREQKTVPSLTINFMEIKEIQKTKKGGFIIKGRTARDIIYVPSLIDNAGELEQQLQRFAPITAATGTARTAIYQLLLFALGLAAMITSTTATNNLLALLAGGVAIALIVWMFITVRRNKNVPVNAKRRSWVYLIFAAVIAYLLFVRIMGFPFIR